MTPSGSDIPVRPRPGAPRGVAAAVAGGGALLAAFVGAPDAARAQPVGVVQGAVVDGHGRAAPGALVILLPLGGAAADPAGGGGAVELEAASDGRFVQPQVPAGLYAVTAALDDRRSEVHRVRVRDGRTVAVHLALATGRRAASWVVAGGDGGDLNELFAAGVAASREGNHAGAIAYFALAADLYPGCVACPYNAAIAQRALGRWAEAERAFRGALAVEPDYVAAYYGLADVYARLDRPDEAAAARAEAARLTLAAADAERREAEATVERGLTLFRAGRLEEARGRFETAVGQSDRHAAAHYWLGVTLTALGRPEAAAGALRRALSLDATGEHASDARARLAALEH